MVKDWPMVLIGDILDFKNGLNKGKEYFGYGTPIVNYTDVYHHSGLYASDIKGSVSLSKDEKAMFFPKCLTHLSERLCLSFVGTQQDLFHRHLSPK